MNRKLDVVRTVPEQFDTSTLKYPREKFDLVRVEYVDTWKQKHNYTRKHGEELVEYYLPMQSVGVTLRCKRCGDVKTVVDRKNISCKQGPCHQNWKDLTGQKFGELTALRYEKLTIGKKKREAWYWICQCSCGRTYPKTAHDLLQAGHIECGYCARKRIIQATTLPDNLAKWHREYRVCRKNAATRKYPFELTFEQYRQICEQPCFYCGANPELRSTGLLRNGVDRFDNTKGYTSENSVPCCSRCNTLKLSMSYDELLAHIERVLEHCRKRSTTIPEGSTPKQVETGSTKNS